MANKKKCPKDCSYEWPTKEYEHILDAALLNLDSIMDQIKHIVVAKKGEHCEYDHNVLKLICRDLELELQYVCLLIDRLDQDCFYCSDLYVLRNYYRCLSYLKIAKNYIDSLLNTEHFPPMDYCTYLYDLTDLLFELTATNRKLLYAKRNYCCQCC